MSVPLFFIEVIPSVLPMGFPFSPLRLADVPFCNFLSNASGFPVEQLYGRFPPPFWSEFSLNVLPPGPYAKDTPFEEHCPPPCRSTLHLHEEQGSPCRNAPPSIQDFFPALRVRGPFRFLRSGPSLALSNGGRSWLALAVPPGFCSPPDADPF